MEKELKATMASMGIAESGSPGGSSSIGALSAAIWRVANILRGTYKASEFRKIILPFTVLRRMDCVLEPTKKEVVDAFSTMGVSTLLELDKKQTKALKNLAQQEFFNVSPLTFSNVTVDAGNLLMQFDRYVRCFSPNVEDIFENFKFFNEIQDLDNKRLLQAVILEFAKIDLRPETVSNHDMGLLFEELLRQFNEESPGGEQYTPRDAVELMAHLLVAYDSDESSDQLMQNGVALQLYDPTCGTGGMLSVMEDTIKKINPGAVVYCFGQEMNGETYSICKSDMLIRGQEVDRIRNGDTLANDCFPDEKFHYIAANPPYGVEWKKSKAAVEAEAALSNSRFPAGLPRIDDGQLLFTQHMITKMRDPLKENGKWTNGGRVAVVHSGSVLFAGDAKSGESKIRKWFLDNDYLDAVIALPNDMFYNTGIGTYILLFTNKKEPQRAGKVQLIDARKLGTKMRKSLGQKKVELSAETIERLQRAYYDFAESDISKIYSVDFFKYRKITVDRPLRVEGIDPEKAYSAKEIKELKSQVSPNGLPVIRKIHPVGTQAEPFTGLFEVSIGGKLRVVEYESDSSLRDTENVQFGEDVFAYFAKEVLPHASDAWIAPIRDEDGELGWVGAEIPFNRCFYVFEPPRPLSVINQEIGSILDKMRGMLENLQ